MYTSTRQKSSYLYTDEQIKSVLQECGIDIASEVDSDYIIYCPYHSNYRTPAAEISKESGWFFCFSCQKSASLEDFIMHVTGCAYHDALRTIDRASKEIDLEAFVAKNLDIGPEYIPFNEDLIERLHMGALTNNRALDYYESRGIKMQSIDELRLGYSPRQDSIIIPVHEPDGRFYVGIQARSIDGKQFLNNPEMEKKKLIYNVHRVRAAKRPLVVESPLDSIRCRQMGVPTMYTFGAYISKFQMDILTKRFKTAIIVPDNDEAGDRMAVKASNYMGDRVEVVRLPARFHDVGNLTDEDIVKMYEKINTQIL